VPDLRDPFALEDVVGEVELLERLLFRAEVGVADDADAEDVAVEERGAERVQVVLLRRDACEGDAVVASLDPETLEAEPFGGVADAAGLTSTLSAISSTVASSPSRFSASSSQPSSVVGLSTGGRPSLIFGSLC
jgi:uncharacterized protein with beta-barrel porin domain